MSRIDDIRARNDEMRNKENPSWLELFVKNIKPICEDIPYLLSELDRITAERDKAVSDIIEIAKTIAIDGKFMCELCKKDPQKDKCFGVCYFEWRGRGE